MASWHSVTPNLQRLHSYGDARRWYGRRAAAALQTGPQHTLYLSSDSKPQRGEVFMLAQSGFWFVS